MWLLRYDNIENGGHIWHHTGRHLGFGYFECFSHVINDFIGLLVFENLRFGTLFAFLPSLLVKI